MCSGSYTLVNQFSNEPARYISQYDPNARDGRYGKAESRHSCCDWVRSVLLENVPVRSTDVFNRAWKSFTDKVDLQFGLCAWTRFRERDPRPVDRRIMRMERDLDRIRATCWDDRRRSGSNIAEDRIAGNNRRT